MSLCSTSAPYAALSGRQIPANFSARYSDNGEASTSAIGGPYLLLQLFCSRETRLLALAVPAPPTALPVSPAPFRFSRSNTMTTAFHTLPHHH